MKKACIEAICGEGKGKTSLAIGESLKASLQGRSVIIIQFLKGNEQNEMDFLEKLEQLNIKLFRFEKLGAYYNELSAQEQEEERGNIVNGINFARKVVATRECDFLVLDELLGVIEKNIVSRETVQEILGMKDDSMQIILTGRTLPDWLKSLTDRVTRLNTEVYTD